MRTVTPLSQVTRMMAIPRSRLIAAVVSASVTLGAAYALAAVSAWLVTTAWTRPPVLDLTVAVVSVRALGISRGVFRYLDRLLTHDVALRGVVNLRTGIFASLASQDSARIMRLRRGDLLARLGTDVDELGDHVIRGLVPAAVSGVMAVVAVVVIAPISLAGATIMLVSLLFASVMAPAAAYRSSRLLEASTVLARSELTARTLGVLEAAQTLRVSGGLPHELQRLHEDQARFDRSIDRAAIPEAIAASAVPAATLLAVAGSVFAAPAVLAQGASAGQLGMLILLPLSAFEAATALPQVARQIARSRAAAARLHDVLPSRAEDTQSAGSALTQPAEESGKFLGDNECSAKANSRARGTGDSKVTHDGPGVASRDEYAILAPVLRATDLTIGWTPKRPLLQGIDLTIGPGTRTAVVGASGLGKTTLLTTLGGLLPPLSGDLTIAQSSHDGSEPVRLPLRSLSENTARALITVHAEDSHVFATTLRENVRVARGDASDEDIQNALVASGLGPWVHSLPDGLSTMLASDGVSVSGGERRRLLLARAFIRRSPITLLDEPTEHLDTASGDELLRRILATDSEDALFPPDSAVVLVTHRMRALYSCHDIIIIDEGRIAVRGDFDTVRTHPVARTLLSEENDT
ncbi:thiol reductant ABC exporter subunit CydC [Devriesea agamarum]|uniref:thiol reductant ABC exporter subunit CydC n=1 Tax=Devriesea agamarum TaxID=472569 RepID=UPI000A066369|nr:thiol reductant ABC exporter subunit CydC [Devriesea agamarum]